MFFFSKVFALISIIHFYTPLTEKIARRLRLLFRNPVMRHSENVAYSDEVSLFNLYSVDRYFKVLADTVHLFLVLHSSKWLLVHGSPGVFIHFVYHLLRCFISFRLCTMPDCHSRTNPVASTVDLITFACTFLDNFQFFNQCVAVEHAFFF